MLLQRLRAQLDTGHYAPGVLVRAELRIAPVDPLNWLQAQGSQTHYYWSSRDGDFEMAGLGEADVLVPESQVDLPGLFALMRHRLSIEWPSMRYYGGFRFSNTGTTGQRWRNFKAYRFIVPGFELVRCGEKNWIACTVRLGSAEATAEALAALEAQLTGISFPPSVLPMPLPRLIGRRDLPDQEGWKVLVDRALAAFAPGELEKVVLARESEFRFETEAPLDPISMLRRLLRHTDHAYEFCFHPRPSRAFLGASPERLFYRNNVYLQSEALAGTRPRGGTDAEDQALGEDLLGNDKELREHRFVLRTVRDHFNRFCTTMQHDEMPSLVRLRNVQHLYTYMEGVLKSHDVDAALIETFHPTPAVGGSPRQKALDWLSTNEPFDRGVYAAPVGWVGFDDAEFCVGIRCGLIEENTLTLYSGAGIVPGSSAEAEWEEIENKMGNFLEALYEPPG